MKKTNAHNQHLRFLLSAGGLGLSPIAPGTFGALAGIPIFLICYSFMGLGYSFFIGSLFIATGILCILTIATGGLSEKVFQVKDPKNAVLDEVAGLLLTYLLFHRGDLWQILVWGFLASRACDILKIPPARQAEKLPEGWGILLDDLIASIYAAGLLHVAAWASASQGWTFFFNL